MKTMQEVQTLISDLQKFYTDVRLLDAAAIERIEEGVRSNCAMPAATGAAAATTAR